MTSIDLDELIDAAARDLTSGEPGRSFGGRVMARVDAGDQPALWRASWAVNALAGLIFALIAIVVWNRVPASTEVPQTAMPALPQARVASPPVADPLAVQIGVAQAGTGEPLRRPAAAAVQVEMIGRPATLVIEALTTEPIVVSALDVAPLHTEPKSIPEIVIENITIEPLATSND